MTAAAATHTTAKASYAHARRRDRRVYWQSHPLLFLALAAGRVRPVVSLGRRHIVNDADAIRQVLTRVPLDRTAQGTTGGTIREVSGTGGVFDETGSEHRASRRALAARLDSRGVATLRPVWQPVLDDLAARLAAGETVDLVPRVEDLAGRTAAALLGLDLSPPDGIRLARAARRTAWEAVAQDLPGLRRPAVRDHLGDVLTGADTLTKTLAVATVTTTYAAQPRAVAWVADADDWGSASDARRREALVHELLRVTAPSPVLPRMPAADADVHGRHVARGEQVLLVVRHAMGAHRRDPDAAHPAPTALSQLAFGVGRHSCPGATLARVQLDDLLATLAPLRPRVVAARVDRRAALPAWGSLLLRARPPLWENGATAPVRKAP